MRRLKPGTAIAVTWFDAFQNHMQDGGIGSVDNPEMNLIDLGFYVTQKTNSLGKKYLVMAQEKNAQEKDDFRHFHYIPVVNIIEMKVLK